MWLKTPAATDVQARTLAYAAAHSAAVIRPGDVPRLLAQAIVATEDERFYRHHGIDSIGIGRAILDDIRYRCACQGASTITQQLAKILYLGGSDRGFHKLDGIALAIKIERHVDKPGILADYLSVVPTGPTIVGMGTAACVYFGHPLAGLDLAGYALLAGLPQAPSAYDPLLHPEAATSRRSEVLGLMVSEQYISQAQATAAAAQPYRAHGQSACS